MNNEMQYMDKLKASGLKVTKQRKNILEFLNQAEIPLTAEQIYVEIHKKQETMNLSTVYRTLESLIHADMVTKIHIQEYDSALYELKGIGHKHYLICTVCKKMIPFEDCPLHEYEDKLENDTGFEIYGHKLYMYGICKECKKMTKAT